MDRVPPVRIPAARGWRRHNSMMSVLSGLLAVGLVVGLSVGSALTVEPTDNTGAGMRTAITCAAARYHRAAG